MQVERAAAGEHARASGPDRISDGAVGGQVDDGALAGQRGRQRRLGAALGACRLDHQPLVGAEPHDMRSGPPPRPCWASPAAAPPTPLGHPPRGGGAGATRRPSDPGTAAPPGAPGRPPLRTFGARTGPAPLVADRQPSRRAPSGSYNTGSATVAGNVPSGSGAYDRLAMPLAPAAAPAPAQMSGRAPRCSSSRSRGPIIGTGGAESASTSCAPSGSSAVGIHRQQADELLAVGARGVGAAQRAPADEVASSSTPSSPAQVERRDRAVGLLADDRCSPSRHAARASPRCRTA